MGWFLRKLDNLGAAVVGGGLAAALSQAPAFANAYLQRLGGRVDEARDTLARIQSGEMLPGASAATIQELTREQTTHLRGLAAQYEALRDAAPALRPLTLLMDFDPKIAGPSLTDFTPALPLDTGGLLWVAGGIVLGLLLWELIKAPGALLLALGGDRPKPSARKTPAPGSATAETFRRKEPHL